TLIISAFYNSTDEYLSITVFSIYQDSIGEIPGFFKLIKNGILDEILTIGIIVGGILVGFSKLKEEDEMISKIRYESLLWATYLNYAIILFFTLFIFGLPYLNVLFYNMFTLLLFFIIRFHYMIYKLNTANHDE
ncbi:MAG: hypothetical protein KBC58_07855, partial [Flavobacterium sp.]|nr:hypothetical protein [Flavobacterium sp.]